MSEALVPVALSVILGVWIVRERYMRSARMVLVTVICAAAAFAVATATPSWSLSDPWTVGGTLVFAATSLALAAAPYALASRFEGFLSALPPSDYREHSLIRDVRHRLWKAPTAETEVEARGALQAKPTDIEEWHAVRGALLSQIELSSRARASGIPLDIDTALGSRRSTISLWRTAIARRSRFFR